MEDRGGTSDEIGASRGRAAARSMSSKELRELHQQGPAAFKPGAWRFLDDEVRRRQSVSAREARSSEDEQIRYPALRSTISLLKLCAVGILIVSVIVTLATLSTNVFVALLSLVGGVLLAISYWAGGELLTLLIDIESGVRAIRSEQRHSTLIS